MQFGAQASEIISKFVILMVILCGAVIGVWFAVTVSDGNVLTPYFIFVMAGGVTFALMLGEKVWLLIPLGILMSGLPVVPVGGKSFTLAEVMISGTSAFFIARFALHSQPLNLLRAENLAIFAFMSWVLLVFVQNPVGLYALGSDTGGARGYFKVGLAFLAFLIVSNQRITDSDCKWIWFIYMTAGVVNMIYAWFFADYEGDYEKWSSFSGATAPIIIFLLSFYSFSQMFSLARIWIILILGAAYGLSLMSGKRAVFAVSVMYALGSAVLRKNYYMLIFMLLGGVALIAFLIVGHGTYFNLPWTVQRTLMNLPGQWDRRVLEMKGESSSDGFRKIMREQAWEKIKEHPVLGEGFAVNKLEIMRIMVGPEDQANVQSLALGSSWHNTWLGIGADFGIPAVIFYAIFFFSSIWLGWKVYKMTRNHPGKWLRSLSFAIVLMQMGVLLRSWTSGSTDAAVMNWWLYGLLISMYCTIKGDRKRDAEMQLSTEPASQGELPDEKNNPLPVSDRP